MLAAYTTSDDFFGLCDALAQRLSRAGLTHAATLTWICAANVDNAVKQWTSSLKKAPGGGHPEAGTAALQARPMRAPLCRALFCVLIVMPFLSFILLAFLVSYEAQHLLGAELFSAVHSSAVLERCE